MSIAARKHLLPVVLVCAVLAGCLVGACVPALAAAPEAPGSVTVGSVGAVKAIVSGVLNPNAEGQSGVYEFLYKASKTECEKGEHAPVSPGIAMGLEHEEVSQELTGLSPETEYTVCLLERNTNQSKGEESVGPAVTFKTSAALESPERVGASNVSATTATLQGVLNPVDDHELEAGSYEFLYRMSSTECDGGKSGPEEGKRTPTAVAMGHRQEVVEAQVEELSPNTEYTFCLLARNETAGETVLGDPVTFTTASRKPTLGSVSFSKVGSSSATVSAYVETGGLETTLTVQYGSTDAYGSEVAAKIPAGDDFATVQAMGLQATSQYHFRALVSNEDGTEYGADDSFETLGDGLAGLPDERVYEMVTPPQNANANVYIPEALGYGPRDGIDSRRPFEVSPNGNAVVYISSSSEVGGTNRGGDQLIARRSPTGGWTQSTIQPEGYIKTWFEGFSSDLSKGVFFSIYVPRLGEMPLSSEEPGAEYPNLYFTSFEGRPYRSLITRVPQETPKGISPQYDGANADFSQLLFSYSPALIENVPAAIGSGANLYDDAGGRLYLVNVLPNGTRESNATFGGAQSAEEGAPKPEAGNGPLLDHVISADGSRIFWTDLNNGDLYVRENAASGDPATVQVDEKQGGSGSSGWGHFLGATEDGSQVFFTDESSLTSNSTAEPGEPDLYKYEVNEEVGKSGRLTDLTVDPHAGEAADVQGIVAISEDGSYIYFVAKGVLAPGASSAGCCNLYVYDKGETRFIASLSEEDGLGNRPYVNQSEGTNGVWQGNLGHRTASATPDGRDLMFMSNQSLTGYDNAGLTEVYIYEFDSDKLICVSCSRSGEPPGSSSEGAAGFVPISYMNVYLPTPISDDEGGVRVFFDSAVPLVPQDTNGQQDVYEWESDGRGSCDEIAGCTYLLSGGYSETSSWLIGASENGNDVFINTRAQLTPEDGNEAFNLFDARVGGLRLPAQPVCTGTGCQGVPGAPPPFATPSSVTFNGVGNFPAVASVKPTVNPRARVLTRAQKLVKALKVCRSRRRNDRRTTCEAQARKRYGSKPGSTGVVRW